MSTPTPYIGAKKGEVAETILLPGDPQEQNILQKHF